MNLYASCNLSSMMRPLFWSRMGPSGFSANYQRSLFLRKCLPTQPFSNQAVSV